jgi:predicted GNAT family N-acyltransferase
MVNIWPWLRERIMEIQHFTWDSKTGDTRLYWDYLRLRKRIFVDERHWPMPCFKGAEFDFYDLPFASYVFLTHKDGSLAAGLRLIRADNVVDYNGQRLTYMINDAFHRRLPTIPSPDMSTSPPPTDSPTWEISRIVSVGGVRATGHGDPRVRRSGAPAWRHQNRLSGVAAVLCPRQAILGFRRQGLGPGHREDESDECTATRRWSTDVGLRFGIPAPGWHRRRIDEPEAMTA